MFVNAVCNVLHCTWYAEFKIYNQHKHWIRVFVPPSPTEENCSCVCMWMCVRAFHFAQMDKRMNFMCAACGAPTFGYFIKLFTFNENENCNYGSVWLTFKKLFFELALFSMGDTNSTHFHSHIPFASRLFVLVFADGVHANEKPFLC